MKKIILMFVVMALSSPFAASANDVGTASAKNLCLLDSANCAASGQSYTLQEIIAQLQTEVGKGTSVYSDEELVNLVSKLNDYQSIFDNITKG